MKPPEQSDIINKFNTHSPSTCRFFMFASVLMPFKKAICLAVNQRNRPNRVASQVLYGDSNYLCKNPTIIKLVKVQEGRG